MTKAELAILEKIFEREITSAMSGGPHVWQSRTKSAHIAKLENGGYIQSTSIKLGGRFPMTVTGWELTHLGRATYCASCPDDPAPTPSIPR